MLHCTLYIIFQNKMPLQNVNILQKLYNERNKFRRCPNFLFLFLTKLYFLYSFVTLYWNWIGNWATDNRLQTTRLQLQCPHSANVSSNNFSWWKLELRNWMNFWIRDKKKRQRWEKSTLRNLKEWYGKCK